MLNGIETTMKQCFDINDGNINCIFIQPGQSKQMNLENVSDCATTNVGISTEVGVKHNDQ